MTEPRKKVIVITGASDGVGAAAAKQLHKSGHRVIIVGRNPSKTRAVAEECGNAQYFLADFQKLDEVRRLAEDLDRACEKIDVLANNAGGIYGRTKMTEDGFEPTYQINHYSPFLLTYLLMDKLIASKASIIQTSSQVGRMIGKIDLDQWERDKPVSANQAYGNSKLANVLFTLELDRRFHSRGVNTAAFHPGVVATSFASDTTSWIMRSIAHNPLYRRFALDTPEQAGKKLVWFCEHEPGEKGGWESGKYYENFKVYKKSSAQLEDKESARKLWELSEKRLGLDRQQQ